MGILSGLLGHASEVDAEKVERQFDGLLIESERIEHAYKLFRDIIMFTNHRLFILDKQGMTGKKQHLLSIPYASIDYFSKETSGHLDFDAEIKLWIKSRTEPVVLEFRKDKNIQDVFRVLSAYVLKH